MRLMSLTPWVLVGGLVLAGCFGSGGGDEDDDGDAVGDGSGPPGWGGGGSDGGGGGGADQNSDDDGDGFTYAEELEAGTNPDYEYSRPYIGSYNVGFCADGVAEGTPGPSGSTYAVGDVMDNFSMMDQNGEEVSLYSFCGHTVMLVTGAFW